MKHPQTSLIVLKSVVIAMGVVLIGGVLLLFTLLYQRSKADIKNNSRFSSNGASCSNEPWPVFNIRSGIKNVIKDNQELIVIEEPTDAMQRITIVDLCSRKTVNTINFRITNQPDL